MIRFVTCAAFLLVVLLSCVQPVSADLIGQSVTGSIKFGGGVTNYFDPANGYVPAGYLNASSTTVVIAEPAIEFGFLDGSNRDTANFTGNQLIVQDVVSSGASDWLMSFTSPAFASLMITEISDTFVNGGVTGILTGNTINLNWAGTSSPGTLTVTFALVPEPASMGLAVIGGFALLGAPAETIGI